MPNWTDDQLEVINNSNNNLIVAAAAGSGKTAVLVERIITKIIRDRQEVDKMLVVTFTNAAAKEMKEKIRNRIDKAIKDNPSDEFLIRQMTLLSNANISTIDSFCGNLVRNHFNEIGIDPSFRLCDSAEEKLVINDIMEDLMERNYENATDEFYELMELYSGDNTDSSITDIVVKLYNKSNAYPWPNEWLSRCKEVYINGPKDDCDVSKYALEIIRLAEEFTSDIEEEKKRQKIATFNDVERYALNILIDSDTKKPTETAKELQEFYSEVMVDEYQDVNDLQEMILKTIASDSKKNYFCVGDVKQSIYSFRLAKPQIFIDRQNLYDSSKDAGKVIRLKSNFRSRHEVLDITNDIFRKLMKEEYGGIEYTADEELNFGGRDIFKVKNDVEPEILILESKYDEFYNVKSKYETEAMMVADRILNLMQEQKVTDKESGKLRNIKYSDIAILIRSTKEVGNVFEEVFRKKGIPSHFDNEKSFFDNMEVKYIISFLLVLDNPNRDIELASVLHGPIYKISNDILAKIRNFDNKHDRSSNLYNSINNYLIENEETDLQYAMEEINSYRKSVCDTPIHKLLEIIYEQTGYLDYVTALPGGEYRRKNLIKLIDKAIEFEKTNYSGLFHFTNYINLLEKYNIDLESNSSFGESENFVRIMSMHKSKGLEFPVVFVSCLGKEFNKKDINAKFVLHEKYGLGMDLVKKDAFGNITKVSTPNKERIKELLLNELYGEEARLLYVALTRAKEKLIITGKVSKTEKIFEENESDKYDEDESLDKKWNFDNDSICKAKCFMDWIINILKSYEGKYSSKFVLGDFNVESDEEVFTGLENAEKRIRFIELLNSNGFEYDDFVNERLSFEYSYAFDDRIRNKYSVSDIKHKAIKEAFDSDVEMPIFEFNEEKKVIPNFITSKSDNEVNMGALYGTAMHRVLECFDFTKDNLPDSLLLQLDNMCKKGLIDDNQRSIVNENKLRTFLNNDIAFRMSNASKNNKLYIEKPFVMEEKPIVVFDDASSELDNILIQGIIDVFFVEDDEIIILDYKTDNIKSSDELVKRYKAQINLYAKAIEKATGKNVKEKILYSFKLDEPIYVE